MALGIDLQAISGLVERAFVFDAGKSVEHLAVVRRRIADTVAGEKWQPEFSCQVNRGVVSVFLLRHGNAVAVLHRHLLGRKSM